MGAHRAGDRDNQAQEHKCKSLRALQPSIDRQYNHDHDHDYDCNKSNRNTADDDAFVISEVGRQKSVRALTCGQRVRGRIHIGSLLQLTRAEMRCDTRQGFV